MHELRTANPTEEELVEMNCREVNIVSCKAMPLRPSLNDIIIYSSFKGNRLSANI